MKNIDWQITAKNIKKYFTYLKYILGAWLLIMPAVAQAYTPPPAVNPQSTVVGLTGTIPSPPPAVGATIAVPSNGESFNALPINVEGICQSGLLIKLFINNVFAGAAECVNSSYKIISALFNGLNNLVVRDYDALDQQGPDSNQVNVTFNNPNVGAGAGITLTSAYAKLGASPGSTLSWPIVVSGGDPSYAVSVTWGDGAPSNLLSEPFAGSFDINHIYDTAGVYTILLKATDLQGNVAYLQLVGLASGPASQASASTSLNTPVATVSKGGIKLDSETLGIIIVLVILIPLVTFWLGSKHRLVNIKKKFESGEGLS